MLLNPFARRAGAHALAVGMVGVKMGEQLAQIGCSDGSRLAAIAAKVGLSGRAVAFVPDTEAGVRARRGGEQAGVLIEVEIVPPTGLRSDDDSFDVVVIDDAGALLGGLDEQQRIAAMREAHRIVRPGGRVMVIGAGTQSGWRALLQSAARASAGRSPAPRGPAYERAALLQAAGFKSIRTLADREGLVFVEAVKPRA